MSPQSPTKTTNRLHFEDLDPFRFEDLCRELLDVMYSWNRLDSIGGEGADDGVDIFGITTSGEPCYCQVKRYKELGPAKIEGIVNSIVKNNEIEENACIILMTACDLSKKGYDSFYNTAERAGFKRQQILTAKSIETLLYNKYPHLLEKYFGISAQKKSTLTGRNLIQRTDKGKNLVEKYLLDPNVTFKERWRNPSLIFKDTELILLSHDTCKLPNRYDNLDLYNKVFPYRLNDGGIDCIVMACARISYNLHNRTWRHLNKTEESEENEVILDCEIINFLPFYNIVKIEDGDEYFNCPIIHCDVSPIWKVYTKAIYRYRTYYGDIIFDENENPQLEESDHEIIMKDLQKRQKSINIQ